MNVGLQRRSYYIGRNISVDGVGVRIAVFLLWRWLLWLHTYIFSIFFNFISYLTTTMNHPSLYFNKLQQIPFLVRL